MPKNSKARARVKRKAQSVQPCSRAHGDRLARLARAAYRLACVLKAAYDLATSPEVHAAIDQVVGSLSAL